MEKIEKFEDLFIWREARDLFKMIASEKRTFEKAHEYDLYRQLVRSAGSAMDNIAEGYERSGNKEYIHFLSVAKASAGEARSQLYRVGALGLIEGHEEMINRYARVAGGTMNLIRKIQASEDRGEKFR